MDATAAPPVLSTPAENIFEGYAPRDISTQEQKLSDEELYVQYEIPRTIRELREGKWKRIALQFPDEMLVDAPRVFENLRAGLRKDGLGQQKQRMEKIQNDNIETTAEILGVVQTEQEPQEGLKAKELSEEETEEKLCILADTSYGACCVDEVAAEHVDAEVVVHYGRTCLSPTARLPVIYVFTSAPLDMDAVVSSFTKVYLDKEQKVCLMADVPYHHHIPVLSERLRNEGYTGLFAPDIIHDPSSLLPNRTIPSNAMSNPGALKNYCVFHISTPPGPLILILSSRVKELQIFPVTTAATQSLVYQPTATALLRRRYALLNQIISAPIIGILINTLSVSNYMAALQHCQHLISSARKKSYTFVVGKVNIAKLANFSEVAAWVVISCWESSLLEGLERDLLTPVVTPFELEVALNGQFGRVYRGEWIGDFSALLGDSESAVTDQVTERGQEGGQVEGNSTGGNWDDQISDDEEPDFDLRTGKYVSRSRPMGRPAATTRLADPALSDGAASKAPPSSALVQRAKGDVVAINGAHSPGADFLRSKRTWQGLGSDHEIAYERDEDGKIRGAAMEEGRSGVAKGYSVGESETQS